MIENYPDITKGTDSRSGSLSDLVIDGNLAGFENWSDLPAQEVQFYARTATEHCTAIGDFDGIDEISNITVLKGSNGTSLPVWSAGGITVSFAVLGRGYSRFLDFLGDLSLRVPIWLAFFGQSKVVPRPADVPGDLPPFNPNVEWWQSDGVAAPASGFTWQTVDPLSTIRADYSDLDWYGGHPGGDRGGIMLGCADFLQRFRGGKVKITSWYLGGTSLSLQWNPYLPDGGSGFGEGYRGFVDRMKASKTADVDGLPDYPHFLFPYVGWSDSELLGQPEHDIVEMYFRLEEVLEIYADVIGPDTIKVLFDYPDDLDAFNGDAGPWTGEEWNYYRTLSALLGSKAIFVPSRDDSTEDRLHLNGNQQSDSGVDAAKAIIHGYGAPGVFPEGAASIIRQRKTAAYWGAFKAPADVNPIDLGHEFQTNLAETKVRLSHTLYSQAGGTGDDELSFNSQIRGDGNWRIHVEEESDPTSFCDYVITSNGTPSDIHPLDSGVPNNLEFDCVATDDGTNWPPAAGTDCKVTLQRRTDVNPDTWTQGFVFCYEAEAEFGGYKSHSYPQRYATEARAAAQKFLATAWGITGGVPTIKIPALLEDNGLLRSVDSNRRIIEGRSLVTGDWTQGINIFGVLFGVTPDPENFNALGVVSGTVRMIGRRTDSESASGYYEASMDFSANFHTAGDAAGNVHMTTGPVKDEIDPGSIAWTSELGKWPLNTGGYAGRNFCFRSPAKTDETWQWDWVVDFRWSVR